MPAWRPVSIVTWSRSAEARVAEQPLREHRWAILATALYRCGRQADALRALRHARHMLVEQLGIEPGAELVDVGAGDPASGRGVARRSRPADGLAALPVQGAGAL